MINCNLSVKTLRRIKQHITHRVNEVAPGLNCQNHSSLQVPGGAQRLNTWLIDSFHALQTETQSRMTETHR